MPGGPSVKGPGTTRKGTPGFLRGRAHNRASGENRAYGGRTMADTHAEDPNVAPTHYEVRERFSSLAYGLAVALGGTAVVLGILLGIFLAND